MRDTIRFAWGTSSLGDFLVAMSNQGLVALEFADERTAVEHALRFRFPESLLIADQEGLAEVLGEVHQVIEGAEHCSKIALDLRGTAYEVKVWQRLREIPTGGTTNYGALAAELGTRDAREVTEAISANPIAILVPCHRVIKKDGSISGYRWGARRKRVLLEREKKLHKAPASEIRPSPGMATAQPLSLTRSRRAGPDHPTKRHSRTVRV